MDSNSRKIIRTRENEYQVLKQNSLYPSEGGTWHSNGRKYTSKGIASLITQNPQKLKFEFEDSELMNILQESESRNSQQNSYKQP